MGDETPSSCWNITGWALVGFAAIMAVAFVIGLSDPVDVATIAVQAG